MNGLGGLAKGSIKIGVFSMKGELPYPSLHALQDSIVCVKISSQQISQRLLYSRKN